MEIPPLRTRPADIREVLDARLDPKHQLTEDEIESLEQLTLEGNYRELEMRVNRLLIEKELGE
jgi:transcriptional regulator with GAF, ATPase, and Fis domain